MWIDKLILWLGERDQGTREYIRQIFPRENEKRKMKEIWINRFKVVGSLLLGIVILVLVAMNTVTSQQVLENGNKVKRQGEEVRLKVAVKDKEKGTLEQKEMLFLLEERKLTKLEKEEASRQAKIFLDKNLKGQNRSLEQVTVPLKFEKNLTNTAMTFSYEPDQEKYLGKEGNVKKENIPEQGVTTGLMVTAKLGDWWEKYSYQIRILPVPGNDLELLWVKLKNAIEKSIKEQKTEKIIQLPNKVGDSQVYYDLPKEEPNFQYVYLGVGVLFLSPFLFYQQQKKKRQERKLQMILDHPAFINKIMLLLSAGLTMRSIIERLSLEYENQRKGGDVRYVYEELWITQNQLLQGFSEVKAIESFGIRCGQLPYLRFSTVVCQNLKKGSQGLIALLEMEAANSFEQRKELVKRIGEEAGTKLLFPMLLMLLLVMGIIMIPAFMSM